MQLDKTSSFMCEEHDGHNILDIFVMHHFITFPFRFFTSCTTFISLSITEPIMKQKSTCSDFGVARFGVF